jgi:AcrR family transcriptional regulator
MALRDEHRQVTRDKILQAVADLLTTEHPADVSIPAVAERSGVSLRTVYRHFPSKEQLLDAAAEMGDQRIAAGDEVEEMTLEALPAFLKRAWRNLVPMEGFLRAQLVSAAGRDIRRRRLTHHREALTRTLIRREVPLSRRDISRLADVMVFLTSAATFLELRDAYGYDLDAAADLMAWATRAVVERAASTKTVR